MTAAATEGIAKGRMNPPQMPAEEPAYPAAYSSVTRASKWRPASSTSSIATLQTVKTTVVQSEFACGGLGEGHDVVLDAHPVASAERSGE